jgi:hypothetical protein
MGVAFLVEYFTPDSILSFGDTYIASGIDLGDGYCSCFILAVKRCMNWSDKVCCRALTDAVK